MKQGQAGERLIPLLQDVLELFSDGATYFMRNTARAKAARNKLRRTKGVDDSGFFAELSEDLERLSTLLVDVPVTWTDGQGTGQEAIVLLLDVVNKDYVAEDEADDEVDGADTGQNVPHPYATIKRILHVYQTTDHGAQEDEEDSDEDEEEGMDEAHKREEHKIAWLCQNIKFERTTKKTRKALLKGIDKCYDALQSASTSTGAADITWRDIDPSVTLWSTPLFDNAELFHKALSKQWKCVCYDNHLHQRANFSFDNLPSTAEGHSQGSMLFPTEDKGVSTWRFARFAFQPGQAAHGQQSQRANGRGHFCDMLHACDERCQLNITSNNAEIDNRPAEDGVIDKALIDTCASNKHPFTAFLNLGEKHAVYGLSEKRRMMLALYLVYAYLHLGGGCWWPYDRNTSVVIVNHISDDEPVMPFFAATFVKDDKRTEFDMFCKLNPAMPSLVALGRMLLSLHLGHYVYMEQIEAELDQYSGKAFAIQIAKAVRACLPSRELQVLKEPPTIRNNDKLRAKFISEVILPIQFILHYGHGVQAREIFEPRLPTVSMEQELPKKLRDVAPVVRQGAEEVKDGFCLHDEIGQQESEQKHVTSANDYMKKLGGCVSRTMESLPPTSTKSLGPVKIAILDTGADISLEKLTNVYDERLVENRTWLLSNKAEGESLVDGDGKRLQDQPLDCNGHGTHATSLLLEATQGTGAEVYVAQVFRGAAEKIVQDEIIDNQTVTRVADAIMYAVDVWKVDIISMSFGFPQRVPEIDKAIQHAYEHNVLMLAAASNCGGNTKCSWPARNRDVLCVFASDGDGNKYFKNPDALSGQYSFATLGCAVESYWPPTNKRELSPKVRRSGTSVATPIAASIAALVITSMRRCEDLYVNAVTQPEQKETVRQEHRIQTAKLGRANRMESVFSLMLNDAKHRDGYQYITPWTLFAENKEWQDLANTILNED